MAAAAASSAAEAARSAAAVPASSSSSPQPTKAAEAASAAGDEAAAAVAAAASEAAEAAAQAARDAAAAVEAGTATAAAAQAAIDEAAEAAAAAAAAAGEASAAAGEAAATAQETAEAAAETAAAAVAAAQEAADAAQEAAESAGNIAAALTAEAEFLEWSVPWPLDEIDLDATIHFAVPADSGGLDQHRIGSEANYTSHGAVLDGLVEVSPLTKDLIPHLATLEWADEGATCIGTPNRAMFHDGSLVTAHDFAFTYDRMGGVAEYHQGGETSDHPAGWQPARPSWAASYWLRNEAVDDNTWVIELPEFDAGLWGLAGNAGNVAIMSKADVERRGDHAVDNHPIGTGPFRFVSHSDEEDFVFERFDDHFNPVDHPIRVPHYAHHKHLIGLVRPEVQSRIAGIEAGEIDAAAELGVNAVAPFIDDPDFTVQFVPGPGWTIHNIFPNLWKETREDGTPNPWMDERVRIAANLTINRAAIAEGLLLGVEPIEPMWGYRGVIGYPSEEDARAADWGYDPARARALLAEAGYPDGFDETLYYTPDWGGDLQEDLVLTTAQMLSEGGIRITPVSLPATEYFTDAYSRGGPTGTAPVALYWFWANYMADPSVMWTCCTNFEGFFTMAIHGDPVLDEIYAQVKIERDPQVRNELTSELFLRHKRGAWFINVIEPPDGVLTRGDVNWPVGGPFGSLGFLNTYSIQKRKAT
jgi:peptide/nickel transport system substrate-binding protein